MQANIAGNLNLLYSQASGRKICLKMLVQASL